MHSAYLRVGLTGMKSSAGPGATEHPVMEVSIVSFKVWQEKPTPKLCIPWAAVVNSFAAAGPRYPCWDMVQGSVDG